MSPRVLFVAVLSCAVLCAQARPAPGQTSGLEDGRRLLGEADFSAALVVFERVLSDRNAPLADWAEAQRNLAVIRFGLGDAAGAGANVAAALAIDPAAQAPAGSPPLLIELFNRVRTERRGESLRVSLAADTGIPSSDRTTLVARVSGAPQDLSLLLSVRCTAEGAVVGARSAPADRGPLEIVLFPRSSTIECSGIVASDSGVDLAVASLRVSGAPARSVRLTPNNDRAIVPPAIPRRTTTARLPIYAGLGSGLVVTVAAIVLFLAWPRMPMSGDLQVGTIGVGAAR